MTEIHAIAYDTDPLVERRFKEISREEGIKLAIETEKKTAAPEYTNEEEFWRYVRRESEFLGYSPEKIVEREIRKAIRWKIIDELKALEKEWDTRKVVESQLAYLRTNKLPYLYKVFKNITDKKFAYEEVKRDFEERLKKGKPAVDVWVIPDKEEDPPITNPMNTHLILSTFGGYLAFLGGLASSRERLKTLGNILLCE